MSDGSPASLALADLAAKAYPSLDAKSYYDLLNVEPAADEAAVRKAFYRISKRLHPDVVQALADGDTQQKLESVYARICEAYRVLSNAERRARYDQGLARGKLRFDFTAQPDKHVPKNPADTLTNEQAKKFYQLGMVCFGSKDWKGAVMNLGFAKSVEPGSALIAAKLAEAEAHAKAARGGR